MSFPFVWQAHGFEETHTTFLQTDLLKLLVTKCSKGTGFSKTWLLRDLEVGVRRLLPASRAAVRTVVSCACLCPACARSVQWVEPRLRAVSLLDTGMMTSVLPVGRERMWCLFGGGGIFYGSTRRTITSRR